MTDADPTAFSPDDFEAALDARWAAFLADLVAHAHEPTEKGDECRELLAEDPEKLRDAWELAGAMMASSPPPLSIPYAIVTFVVMAVLATALVVWGTPWLSSWLL